MLLSVLYMIMHIKKAIIDQCMFQSTELRVFYITIVLLYVMCMVYFYAWVMQ